MKTYKTLVVDRKTVTDVWGLPYYNNEAEAVKIMEDTITDTGRWCTHHKLVVKIKDKYYQTDYSTGATEQQDERPWQDDENVEFTEVKPFEKMVTTWKPVELDDNSHTPFETWMANLEAQLY